MSTTTRRKTVDGFKPPNSYISAWFWRQKIWFESTFVFSMLERWEKILLLTIFTSVFIIVSIGLFKYLPDHSAIMLRRATYYIYGHSPGTHSEGYTRILDTLKGFEGARWLGKGPGASVGTEL